MMTQTPGAQIYFLPEFLNNVDQSISHLEHPSQDYEK